MRRVYNIITIVLLITLSTLQLQSCDRKQVITKPIVLDSSGNTVKTRFKTPDGYTRSAPEKKSFAEYLQNLPLKPEGTKALNYDGIEKRPDDVYAAVVNIDVGDKDLQQCADAVMRLRAEYLYGQKKYDEIKFNFTSGFTSEYSKWRYGYRISVNGNNVSWIKKSEPNNSYSEFRKYLDVVFMYAGTLSLEKELTPIDINDIEIGSVFIKGGSPGHAVIVVDLAENKTTGDKIFLIAQSYMPAQDIQILKNMEDSKLSPWYSIKFGDKLETPEWMFKRTQLRRF
jgi:Domain of unknown function (4846)